MRQPLGEFAQRVVRNDEVGEFVGYLLKCGADPGVITNVVNTHEINREAEDLPRVLRAFPIRPQWGDRRHPLGHPLGS